MRDNVRYESKITISKLKFSITHDYHVEITPDAIVFRGIRSDEVISFHDMDGKSILAEIAP